MTLYSEVRAARCKETGFTMKCTDQHFYAQHFYVSQAQLLCSTCRIPRENAHVWVAKLMCLTAHICCSEDIYVAVLVSLCNSIESKASNQHICGGSIDGCHVHLKEGHVHLKEL